MDKKEEKKLQPEVADKYNLVGTKVGKFHFNDGFGVIDLEKLSVEKADVLVARGFTHLQLKASKKAAAADNAAGADTAKSKPAEGAKA
jgi:hypothetical protein